MVKVLKSELDNKSNYEGLQDAIRNLKTPEIEVFKNIYADTSYRIDFEIPEFTAICPRTCLPDFGTFYISYRPGKHCLELKSLKEYFLYYRNLGIFQENVTVRVRFDLVEACHPLWLRIHLDYNVRGGIKTRVSSTYKAKHKVKLPRRGLEPPQDCSH